MTFWKTVGTSLIGATLVISGVVLWEELNPPRETSTSLKKPDAETIRKIRLSMGNTPAESPGLRLPPTVSAEGSRLADDAPIIGVQINDTFRAYSLDAMSGVTTHVVNDLVDGQAVSVTYCDRTECARVFTRDDTKDALAVGVGAWLDGEMNIQIEGQFYPQSSDEVPLQDLPFVKTTWKSWREAHPETEVFAEYSEEGTPAG